MKTKLEGHSLENKRIQDTVSGKVYIIEGVYIIGDEFKMISFLIRREGTDSHGQLEWEILDSFVETNDINKIRNSFWENAIKENRKNYAILD